MFPRVFEQITYILNMIKELKHHFLLHKNTNYSMLISQSIFISFEVLSDIFLHEWSLAGGRTESGISKIEWQISMEFQEQGNT